MRTPINAFHRNVLGLMSAVLAFAFVTLMVQLSLSADDLDDRERRQKVEDMYDDYKKEFLSVPDITPQEVMTLKSKSKAVLIDIREPDEQQISMLPGAITEEEFVSDPAKYEDAVKVVYCTISYRSGKFAQKLQKKNIMTYNLRGGILGWVHAGGKVYDQNGETQRIHVYGRKWNLGPKRFQAVW